MAGRDENCGRLERIQTTHQKEATVLVKGALSVELFDLLSTSCGPETRRVSCRQRLEREMSVP